MIYPYSVKRHGIIYPTGFDVPDDNKVVGNDIPAKVEEPKSEIPTPKVVEKVVPKKETPKKKSTSKK